MVSFTGIFWKSRFESVFLRNVCLQIDHITNAGNLETVHFLTKLNMLLKSTFCLFFLNVCILKVKKKWNDVRFRRSYQVSNSACAHVRIVQCLMLKLPAKPSLLKSCSIASLLQIVLCQKVLASVIQ